MNNPIFDNCNPHPSDVRDLEPVIFEAGLNYVSDLRTREEISPNTKLYIVKYIGTLQEIKDNSMGTDKIENDKTNYGTVETICLYKNAALEKFNNFSNSIIKSEDKEHGNSRRVVSDKYMNYKISTYLKAKGIKTRNRKFKKSKKSKRQKNI